jgi:nucleotide-binding universal stress UspA family protein
MSPGAIATSRAGLAATEGARLRHVLFATDLSRPADRALGHASQLAERFGAQLTLYHAVETPRAEAAPRPVDPELEAARRAEQAARERMEHLAARLRGPHRVFVERKPSAARAVASYIDWTRPDLTVMGTHGHHAVAYLVMGSVTEYVLEHARRPVLCVREPEHGAALPYRRILVPTDLRRPSRRAFPLAALLMDAFDAEAIVLHVAPAPSLGSLAGLPERIEAKVPDEAAVRRFIGSEFDGLRLQAKVTFGSPCQGIAEVARVERADCIVMATCGRDSLPDRILGTHCERVIRNAPCPVLVV